MEAPLTDPHHRHSGLDGLRGLAIGLVLLHHLHVYSIYWWPQGHGLSDGHLGQYLGFFWIGVDLFYVLSGYFISQAVLRAREWNPQHFARQRLTRIIPAYYISMLVIVLLLERHLLSSWPGWTHIGIHLFMLHHMQNWSIFSINGPYWTLGIEFSYYVLMLALAPWWRGKRGWLVIPLFFAIALVWRAGVIAGVPEVDRFFVAAQIPGALDEFACGMLVAMAQHHKWFDKLGKYRPWFAMAALVVGLGLVAYTLARYIHPGPAYWTSRWHVIVSRDFLCAGFALWLASLLAWQQGNPVQVLLRWSGLSALGTISYSFYLYHSAVMLFVYRHVPSVSEQGGPAFIAVCVAASLGLAWLSHRYIEKRWHPSA